MFELCRKIVAGPKKKLEWNGKQLDLTYVTDRVIAMAFPASGLQSAYRNSIKDVAQYLHQKHNDNYLIINVSSRKYDYKYFHNKVSEYEWQDHLSPPLTTLFEISREMYEFLKNNKHGVVAVHCNHGKGRTGTSIISFIMFTGFFTEFDQTLNFYNKRRFVSNNYGVSQPCQKRYLQYFQRLRQSSKIEHKLITYKIKNIKQKGLQKDNYFLQISSTRNREPKYRELFFCDSKKKFIPNVPLIGDVCIQIFYDKWKGKQQIAMINCNTYFFNEEEQNSNQICKLYGKIQPKQTHTSIFSDRPKLKTFRGQNVKVNGKHSTKFELQIQFQPFCGCHFQQSNNPDCSCQQQRKIQQSKWSKLIQNINLAKNISKLQSCGLLFQIDYLNEQLQIPSQVVLGNISKKSEPVTVTSSQKIEIIQNSSIITQFSEKKSQYLSKAVRSCEHQNDSPKLYTNPMNQDFQYDFVVMNRNSI